MIQNDTKRDYGRESIELFGHFGLQECKKLLAKRGRRNKRKAYQCSLKLSRSCSRLKTYISINSCYWVEGLICCLRGILCCHGSGRTGLQSKLVTFLRKFSWILRRRYQEQLSLRIATKRVLKNTCPQFGEFQFLSTASRCTLDEKAQRVPSSPNGYPTVRIWQPAYRQELVIWVSQRPLQIVSAENKTHWNAERSVFRNEARQPQQYLAVCSTCDYRLFTWFKSRLKCCYAHIGPGSPCSMILRQCCFENWCRRAVGFTLRLWSDGSGPFRAALLKLGKHQCSS